MIRRLALVFILTLVSGPLAAADTSVNGEFFGNYYGPTLKRDKAPTQASESLWASGNASSDATGMSAHLSGSFTEINASHLPEYPSGRSILRFDEAYLHFSGGDYELSAGRRVILWGRADTINPTDFHSGTDQTILSTDSRFTRNSPTGIDLVWRPTLHRLVCRQRNKRHKCTLIEEVEKKSHWSIEAVYTPMMAESKILYGYTPLPANVEVERTLRPDVTVANSEYALKLSYSGTQWDASLSGFHGYDHHPIFFETKRLLVGATPVVQVTPQYVPINALGGDASLNAGGAVFTVEGSFVWPDASPDVTPPMHLSAVGGIDYELFDNFHTILQGIAYYFPTLQELAINKDAVTEAIRQANALLERSQKREQFGSSLHLLYDDSDSRHKLDIFAVKFFGPADGYVQPKYTFKFTGAFSMGVGADIFFGPSNSPLGSLRDLSSYFAEVKYLF